MIITSLLMCYAPLHCSCTAAVFAVLLVAAVNVSAGWPPAGASHTLSLAVEMVARHHGQPSNKFAVKVQQLRCNHRC